MCERARTAIEVIQSQKRKTLTKEETLMLFQKVIEDSEKMGVRMTNLEKRMEVLENKMDAGFKKLERIITKKEEHGLIYKILLGQNAKYFYITLIVALLLLGGLLGVPTTGFNGILNIGG